MKVNTPQQVSYMTRTKMAFALHNITTYQQLLKKYDQQLHNLITAHNPNFLQQPVYVFHVSMQPEQLDWIIWKNQAEIFEFMERFNDEINEMLSYEKRMANGGKEVSSLHRELSGNRVLDQTALKDFEKFLNLVAKQPYLNKTEDFLLFIEHCMPTDKWNIKIYNQISVDKAPSVPNAVKNFVTKPCSSGEEQNRTAADRGDLDRDYFITITSDGILKGDNHPMQSMVTSMIPFTNQLTSSPNITKAPDSYLSFSLNSCYHEKININFYKDYTNAVNFALGLRMALEENQYSTVHRFESYSVPRENCASKLYNDGVGYFEDLYEELSRAQYQVCITGWMITPYFLLQRPNKITNKEKRLDGVLEEIAERGVKIFIIAFQEPSLFVNNDSEHAETYLMSLHRNITVLRHPNNVVPSIWSHHEKLVVIDQKIGFMGGLDICYGRWDTPQHFLVERGDLWDGCDYNNYRTKDIYEPRDYLESNLNPHFQVRMPWHDIAIQYRGDVVIDLLRHFVQYWYYVKWDEEFTIGEFIGMVKSKASPTTKTQQLQVQASKDYAEKKQKQFSEKLKAKKKEMDVRKKLSDQERNDETIPELFIQSRAGRKVGNERLQMCRSANTWSLGIEKGKDEHSIHNAYQDLIKNSKKHIYIENQFFMGLENKIVECLANRILQAHQKGEAFRVVIVLPLLPGFEGDIAQRASSVLRIQVHYQYEAIIKGENSLYKRLHSIPNIEDYVFFYGLRIAEKLQGVPVTEIIYVHSKLMIVDDCRAIIGSANINDRSLLGSRDSELACVIEEDKGNIFDLRARLFDEHFGLSRQESQNHCSGQVWAKMIKNARKNTEIYRKVFGCVPDNKITIVSEINKLACAAKILKYDELKGQIIGHAVEYPLQFFKDEDLTFKPDQKEYFAPEGSFT